MSAKPVTSRQTREKPVTSPPAAGRSATRSPPARTRKKQRYPRSAATLGIGRADPAQTDSDGVGTVVGGFDYETIPTGYYDGVYRRRRGVQSKWHHLKFKRVIEEMQDHPRHLDVGCGPGTLIGMLDDRFLSTGIDISTTQIAYARREYESESKHFFALTVAALADDCRDYDVATVVELIEHLPRADAEDLLWATIGRLRPGGKLVVTTPNFRSAWPLVERLVNRFGQVDYTRQHINRFTPHLLRQLLQSLGLKDVRVHSFLAVAPFVAPLGWRLSDTLARLERGTIERTAGLLLLGTGTKPGMSSDDAAAAQASPGRNDRLSARSEVSQPARRRTVTRSRRFGSNLGYR